MMRATRTHLSHFALGVILGLCVCLVNVGRAAAPAETSGLTGDHPLEVWVAPEGLESYTISLAEGSAATIDKAKPGHEGFSVDGVYFELSPEGYLSLTTDCQTVALRAAQCGEWRCTVPYGNRLLVKVNKDTGLLDLISPIDNVKAVLLHLCDGGRAEVYPGAVVRFQEFKDQTYYLAASGKVKAVNADGKTFDLSPRMPPMVGGPLVETTGTDGTRQFRRLSPVTQVVLSGDLLTQVTAAVGGQVVTVVDGGQQQVTLANGSVLDLSLDKVSRTLNWRVERGDFDFRVEGVAGWQAAGLSGQSGSDQWDTATRSIMIQNRTDPTGSGPTTALLVSPTKPLFVSVDPYATFQITQTGDANSFASSATGGRVVLYSASTGQEVRLDTRNLLFIAGLPVGTGPVVTPGVKRIEIDGDRVGVQLSGDLGSAALAPGMTKSLVADGNSSLQIKMDAGGQVVLTAVGQKVAVIAKMDSRVAVEIEPGNSIVIDINQRQGTTTFLGSNGNQPGGASFVIAGGDSSASAARGSMELGPNTPLTIAEERSGSVPGNAGTMVFFESAGSSSAAGGNTALTQATAPASGPVVPGRIAGSGFGAAGDQLDASRISQPPVSTIH